MTIPIRHLFWLLALSFALHEAEEWNLVSWEHAHFTPRRLRAPQREPATDLEFDAQACTVRCVIPAREALELEFDPLVGDKFYGSGVGVELSVEGSVGEDSLSGPQVVRQFAERAGRTVYEYRGP